MSNINQYIKLSPIALGIKRVYEKSDNFSANYAILGFKEQQSYINHIIVNNTPFAFKEMPILWEQIILYLAETLSVNFNEIKIIGSAKTGFSISPESYGKSFSATSDLDLTIISNNLFDKLKTEFEEWNNLYNNQKLLPLNATEEKYWPQNLEVIPKNIYRGFIDTHKIPNREQFPFTQKINQTCYLLGYKLNEFHKIPNNKISLRVYKNWDAFYKQLRLNTELVLQKI